MPAGALYKRNGARRNRTPQDEQPVTAHLGVRSMLPPETANESRSPLSTRHLGLPPRHGPLPRGSRRAAGPRRAPPGRGAARHAAAARAPSRLHPRAALPAGGADARRELLPRARHRGRAHRPRRARHLPRPRPARGLPDHGRHRRRRAPAHSRGRDRRRARRGGHRTRAPARRTAPTTPACGWRIARSPRSGSTSRAGSPHTGSPSTWTTTWSPSRGSSPAGCPTSR